jgi:thiol:disulfide interchange protein
VEAGLGQVKEALMKLEMNTETGAARTRYLLITLALLLLIVAVGYALGMPILGLSREGAAEQKPAPLEKVTEVYEPPQLSPIWYRDADGYEKAKQERDTLHVPLIVYFYTDWCGYCRALDRDILSSEEVKQFVQTVAKVRINPELGVDERELAQMYGVTGYPSVFVIPADNDWRQRIYPFVRAGDEFTAMSPNQFVAACKTAGISR